MTTRCPACGGTKKIMDYIEARATDCMVPLVPCPCVALAAANAARLVAEQMARDLDAELLRVRTTGHGAAHELDNIAVELGLGHSPQAGVVAAEVRRLKAAEQRVKALVLQWARRRKCDACGGWGYLCEVERGACKYCDGTGVTSDVIIVGVDTKALAGDGATK